MDLRYFKEVVEGVVVVLVVAEKRGSVAVGLVVNVMAADRVFAGEVWSIRPM